MYIKIYVYNWDLLSYNLLLNILEMFLPSVHILQEYDFQLICVNVMLMYAIIYLTKNLL